MPSDPLWPLPPPLPPNLMRRLPPPPLAGFTFQSVADDVRQLLDELGMQRVVFMGMSGGGPYACACACLLPQRTSAVCLVAGMTATRGAPGVAGRWAPVGPGRAGPGSRCGMSLFNRLGYLAINHAPGPTGAALGAGTALLRLAGACGVGPVAAAARKQRRAEVRGEVVLGEGRGGTPELGAGGRGTVVGLGREGGSGANGSGPGGGGAVGCEGSSTEAAATAEGPGGSSVSDPAGIHTKAASGAVTAPPAGPPEIVAAAEAAAADGGAGGEPRAVAAASAGRAAARAAAGVGLSGAATALTLAAAGFPAVDRAAVARHLHERPELARLVSAAGAEVAAQGLGGLWRDMRLTSEPWGLPLERITGDADLNVTVSMARHLHSVIPGAAGRLTLVPGAGHLSLGLEHGREVLAALAGHLRAGNGGAR
ncbi:hypothetical protein GPECTOR_2g1121 [Gonium pectorale]|uniref:AB hydrolase-1 domain-containing protein n=1 Tax=Gonium pectorale TaxID=33097 RepID=A0A150H0R0_GONPE|nr:hypothetical protein GPECTOR_2g1121 [Gonium pectorale]|eukprot:KXZ55572.1 hypothetical protein GPECTOR_2g1121 [Gonium pectorale]